MNNREKLVQCFATTLGIPPTDVVDTLTYESISQWDSVAHMALVAEIESSFDVMLDTDDILAMSSVKVAQDTLAKHGVQF